MEDDRDREKETCKESELEDGEKGFWNAKSDQIISEVCVTQVAKQHFRKRPGNGGLGLNGSAEQWLAEASPPQAGVWPHRRGIIPASADRSRIPACGGAGVCR